MGIPVKLKVDGFVYLGEIYAKGDVFDAPHEQFASYLCDQENQATRIDESKLKPADGNSMKRVMKGGSYNTKVMEPGSSDDEPVITKPDASKQVAPKTLPKKTAVKQKSNVKAKSDAVSENT